MLTFVAAPKAFTGHVGRIQRRAIASWAAAAPGAEIVLVGDEPGTAEAAREFGASHGPSVEETPFGTPRLDAVLAVVSEGVVCYVNADILMPADFGAQVARVAESKDRFLLVGECDNVDLDADPVDWTELRLRSTPRGHDYIDYFVFPAGLFGEVPPFGIGRAGFDNWLVRRALEVGAPVIDASPALRPLHQNHTYDHLAQPDGAYVGAEADENRRLAAGKYATILDATHRLTGDGVSAVPGSRLGLRRRRHRLRLAAGRVKSRLRG
jgi:hypothetical protein